jgi:hypothetical protein
MPPIVVTENYALTWNGARRGEPKHSFSAIGDIRRGVTPQYAGSPGAILAADYACSSRLDARSRTFFSGILQPQPHDWITVEYLSIQPALRQHLLYLISIRSAYVTLDPGSHELVQWSAPLLPSPRM